MDLYGILWAVQDFITVCARLYDQLPFKGCRETTWKVIFAYMYIDMWTYTENFAPAQYSKNSTPKADQHAFNTNPYCSNTLKS